MLCITYGTLSLSLSISLHAHTHVLLNCIHTHFFYNDIGVAHAHPHARYSRAQHCCREGGAAAAAEVLSSNSDSGVGAGGAGGGVNANFQGIVASWLFSSMQIFFQMRSACTLLSLPLGNLQLGRNSYQPSISHIL